MSDSIPTSGGQDASTPAPSTGQAVEAPSTGQAFSFEYGEGDSKQVFNDPSALSKYIKEGTLRHSDYTKKTQEVAKLRKQHEAERRSFQQQMESFKRKQDEYGSIDSFLTKRPDVRNYILNQMRNPSPDAVAQQLRGTVTKDTAELRKQLKELQDWKRNQEVERVRAQALTTLKQKYPDFDEKEVEKEIKQLNEMPNTDDLYSAQNFMELMYYANKGRRTPAEVERNMSIQASKRKGVPSTGSSGMRGGGPSVDDMSIDDAARAYLEGKIKV